MEKIRGNSLVNYIIVICLICLGVVPIYSLYGQQIKQMLTNYYDYQQANNIKMKMNSTDDKLITNGAVVAGQMGGEPTNPVRKCVGDICAIDYGTIILNKIPSKLEDSIETSGSVGDTEIVLGLVNQIASQLEKNPNVSSDQLAKIKTLISQGNDILNIEKRFETVYPNVKDYYIDASNQAKTLKTKLDNKEISTSDYNTQSYNISNTLYKQTMVAEKDALLYSKLELSTGNKTVTNFNQMYFLLNPNAVLQFSDKGGYGASSNGIPNNFDDYIDGKVSFPKKKAISSSVTSVQRSPVGEYLSSLKEILQDKNLDPAAKDLTKILSKEIYQVSQTVYEKTSVVTNLSIFSSTKDIELTLKKPASQTTQLDLSIICASNRAKYNFDNNKCTDK